MKQESHGRLLSLDVFRGMTIAGMVLVNCPGNDNPYPILAHADWNGCTFADLIFPAFLVIMGISLTLSLGRRLERGDKPLDALGQAFRRSAIIFFLGTIISAVMMPQLGVFRIPGVLQRIAACDLACAVLFLWTGPVTQGLVAFALLAGYFLLMVFVPVPGRGAGDLTPNGNLASYVDRIVFGEHMFAETHDPEGLLSTLPAIATALVGVLAGHWLASKKRPGKKALDLLIMGAVLMAGGLLWSRWFPMNKNIWTSSFALFTSGTALATLAFCYWTIESLQWRSWGKPFDILGRNALASYFLTELFYGLQEFIHIPGRDQSLKEFLCAAFFGRLSEPNAALAYAVVYVGFCVLLMNEFYRRKIFIKV